MAVGILIQSKADVNLPIKDGSTALMHAAVADDAASTSKLLALGASLNVRNRFGFSALMWATRLQLCARTSSKLLWVPATTSFRSQTSLVASNPSQRHL